MQEVAAILADAPALFLATLGLDGKPHVRPFTNLFVHDNQVYLSTAKRFEGYAEIVQCPYVELSAATTDRRWVRIRGKAVFTEDAALKQRVLNQLPNVMKLFQTVDNPDFALFYIAEGSAAIMPGKPPRIVTF
ncbi:pyridoxamine 5'-phosphate oxidase family protein [Eubacteriales bacterium OttesenSCG-928-N14]|nr:pyridoxamine 5'-phosphate oxidase family protein [Eubacteriales bacterium OttesenSCG-928-N14]